MARRGTFFQDDPDAGFTDNSIRTLCRVDRRRLSTAHRIAVLERICETTEFQLDNDFRMIEMQISRAEEKALKALRAAGRRDVLRGFQVPS
jgi:hypothetical protein